MSGIKQYRLTTRLNSCPKLTVGDCVPFYFCPRSVMLYVIYKANHPELDYRGGQEPIVHLEADLREVVDWANRKNRLWAFTLSNAGSRYFEDRCDLNQLSEIDWQAVQTRHWNTCKDGKQAEFLVERSLPWSLVRNIGVYSERIHAQVRAAMRADRHQPAVKINRGWYY